MSQSYRSNLTDEQWNLLSGLIPPAKPGGHPRSVDMQAVFNLQKVWARDLWYLTSRLNRKLMAHMVCIQLNCCYALEPLQFDDLLTR